MPDPAIATDGVFADELGAARRRRGALVALELGGADHGPAGNGRPRRTAMAGIAVGHGRAA